MPCASHPHLTDTSDMRLKMFSRGVSWIPEVLPRDPATDSGLGGGVVLPGGTP